MPSLMICEDSCIIKANGMPFGSPMSNGWWDLLVSAKGNPVYYFLEVIWTRLHYMFGITAEIFGEDLELDQVHPFLSCRLRSTELMTGWEYHYNELSHKQLLANPLEKKEWEPAFLDVAQYLVMQELCREGIVKYAGEADFEAQASEAGYTSDSFIKSLIDTGLVYADGVSLHLLTDKCLCGISVEGKYFAGDDRTGRVTRWMFK
jgi:hypothetical protein